MAARDTRAVTQATGKTSPGSRAEQIALDHLLKNGLSLVERNFHCRLGEIDLVMRDADCLVFVEVRFRSHSRFASAFESVDRRKQQKLIAAASFFLARRPTLVRYAMRFDVIALDGASPDEFRLQWLRDAFRPD